MSRKINVTLLAFTVTTLFGFINAQAMGSKDLFRCRQSCYQKFVQDWHHCMDFDDCKNMCITPPNINSYIPEAFSFLCWNNCDQQLGPFPLNINSALRQGSLVLTDIAWDQAITNASKQCLVTWEVSGGGLMGNLLTDSSTVELSLWPDTVYHVQVTCKHKETGGMRRSYKLIVDTHKLSESTATGMQAIALDTGISKTLPNIYAAEQAASSGETDSRMRILKDSSKDFLSPYNPNANMPKISNKFAKPLSADSSSSSSPSSSSSGTRKSHAENEVSSPSDTVIRTKVEALPAVSLPTQIGLCALGVFTFIMLVLVYIYRNRQQTKELTNYVDREMLIESEMVRGQASVTTTPAKSVVSTPAREVAATHIVPAAVTLATAEARTLHV